MKKQKTLLIIVLIVAIAMIGLYAVIGFMADKKATAPQKSEKMLTELENVTYVQYTNPDATVTLVKTDDKWACEENAELVLVHGFVDEKMEVLAKVEGTHASDVEKADCGLEKPVYTLTIKNAEKTVKLSVGISEDSVVYAMVDGDDSIYEISEDVVEVLDMNAEKYAEPSGDVYSYITDVEEDTTLEGDDAISEDENMDIIIEEEPEEEPEIEIETEVETETETNPDTVE